MYSRWSPKLIVVVLGALMGSLLPFVQARGAAPPKALTAVVSPMDGSGHIEMTKGKLTPVKQGPDGSTVLCSESPFEARIDLKPLGIDPHQYHLLKLQIKTDAHAFVRISLENFPKPGQLAHWYVLDEARPALPWRTIWIDLNHPEEIKEAGSYKGMAAKDPGARGLLITGRVGDLNRSIQSPGRSIWLGPIRFANAAVHLDWDQARYSYTKDAAKDLTFTYPLTVTNRLEKAVTAELALTPLQQGDATAELSPRSVTLKPGEMQMVQATITLPASVARKSKPLYAERFLATASARGIDDSTVTILRSSDPIPLTVTVPIPEKKLTFPLLPRIKDIPGGVTGLREGGARKAMIKRMKDLADAVSPDDLNKALDGPLDVRWANRRGFNYWGKHSKAWDQAGGRYLRGLTACAFLYDLTGDKTYLKKGTALLLRAAELFPTRLQQWRDAPYSPISRGIFSPNTLGMGWSTGSMRSPYDYDKHGMFNDFDLLAADMDPAARTKIIHDFIVPAAIHMRNQLVGLSNQQDVTNYPALYAGLAARNWPLVTFAYSSSHGLLGQIKWAFSDAGLAAEGNYHTPSVRPILYATELLYASGVDLYNKRLYHIVHSPGAEAIGKPFKGAIVAFIDKHRFGNKDELKGPRTDGTNLSTGLTVLRWKGREVGMNWGMQLNRGAHDRCALRINPPGGGSSDTIGGGNYTHSSMGQSIIIIDEGLQHSVPAKVTGVDVVGPVQFVQATSDKHYPGTTITRTFALLGDMVLAVDRVHSDAPHTVDWCLRYRGGSQDAAAVAKTISPTLAHKSGSFTDKPNDKSDGVIYGARLKSDGYFVATTGTAWRQQNGAMTMAGQPHTQVMAFAVPAAFSAWKKEKETGVPVMMARRTGVKDTVYVAAFSPDVVKVEVERAKASDAVNVVLTLEHGKAVHATVYYGVTGDKVFTTDYKPAHK